MQVLPGATITDTGDRLCLCNGLIELGFSPAHHGALVSILDKASGHDLIREKDAPKLLFRLALRDPDTMELEWLESGQATSFAYEEVDEGDWKTLVLTNTFADHENLSVEVRVALEAGSALSSWQMVVHNTGPHSVFQLVCPIVSGLVKLGDPAPGEALAVPLQSEGYLFKNPYPVRDRLPLCTGDGPESPHVGLGHVQQMYPGALSMQMYAFYNDFAGLYFAAHDSGQNPKSFAMGPLPLPEWKETPALSMAHFNPFSPGKSVAFAYPIILGLFHGDWYDAADMYKAWATQQWWCETKLWDRDIADWIRNGFGVFQMSNYHIPKLQMDHTLEQIVDTTNEISREIDTTLQALIFNWEGGGAWTGPIGFFPPREGETPFREAMARLRAAGNHGFLYMPGGAWYLKLPYDPPFDSWDAFEAQARPHAVMSEHGTLHIGRWWPGWEITRTCAYTDFAKKLHLDLFLGCIERGASWIQIDNFPCGAVESCYDPSHGHEIGYAAWWSEAWGETLAEIRRQAKAKNPDCAMSTEGISENFIPYLDLYDQRAPNMEYFGHFAPGQPMGGETIPIFGYVYHEYIGGYTAAMPECNRPEVLYWTRCLGKALAEGIVPNGGAYFPEPKEFNPITLGFYKRVVRAAAKECWPYLMFGEMLRPPVIDVPRITAAYCKFSSDGHSMDPTRRHEVEDAAVQHSAWRGRDGSIGYIFANVSEEAVEFDVALSAYQLTATRYRVERVSDGVSTVVHADTALPLTEHLCLKPLSVTLIVVKIAV